VGLAPTSLNDQIIALFTGDFTDDRGPLGLPPVLFRVPRAVLSSDSGVIEMRQGRLSITKSPWFDFFTASPRADRLIE
jgi:hypothetical protein